jgi:hypothetical protein
LFENAFQTSLYSESRAFRFTCIVAFATFALFAALLNPYWSRGGDSEVYLAIARNLYHGKGLTFNNNPVAVVLPLWPWVLALALKLSSSFLFLKLIPMLSMTGAMAIWHRVLLRYLTAGWAAVVVLLCAFLSQLFMLSLWFHTEAFYCLLSSLAVLLSMQINEGKSFWWRAILVLLLLIACCMTRWAGIMWWGIIAAALLRGEWPGMNRKTILVVISLLAVVGTFREMRRLLKVDPSTINPMYDTSMAGAYDIDEIATEVSWRTYGERILGAGAWFGGLFWQAAREFQPLRLPSLATGWIVALLLMARTLFDLRQKDWLLLAAMGQAGLLVFSWPSPVARYLVPLAPIFMLAVFRVALNADMHAHAFNWYRIRKASLHVFIASIILCNLVSYSIEVLVARKSNYYAQYQGGLNDELIDIARYIDDHQIPEGRIAINRADTNGARTRISNGWLRAFVVLTDRAVRNLPEQLEGDRNNPIRYAPDDPTVIQWLQQEGITHYLRRGASNTMWHFRRGSTKNSGEWELYEIRAGTAIRIDVPEVSDWPRNLPGVD